MTSHPLSMTLAAAAALALAGCGQRAEGPAEAPAEVPAAPAAAPAPVAVAPAVDQAALKGLLSPDETLEVLTLDATGAASASGEVKGYKATVYAVPVAQGQTLSVTFEPSNRRVAGLPASCSSAARRLTMSGWWPRAFSSSIAWSRTVSECW